MTEAPIEFIVRLRGGAEAAAQAKQVEGAVRSMGGQVTKVGEDSVKTAKKTTAFGSSLKHVALGLGAVGAGFIAYNKAKQAIDYTINLTRTSTALSKATGLSVGEASKLSAVSEALGVNSTKLAAVFTKVGSATVKQAEHTGKTATAFDRLGISQDFAKKHLNDTAGVLDAVTHAFVANHIPALERSKMMTELFGRAWLPLGPLFLEGETNFKHLTSLAKEFGLELGGGAKELTKLKEQQEEYTLSTMGLKVAFTKVVAGPLGEMLSGFAKLTVFAKANQWGKFNREVERIATQFETLAEKVMPHVAEGFAHMAPAVLKAFWRGFSHASLGAQVLIAGVIASKLGLTGAIFSGIGKTLGMRLAGGVAAETGAASAAGTALGVSFGAAFALAAAGYLAYNVLKGDKNEPEPLSEAWHGLVGGYTATEEKQRKAEARERERFAKTHTPGFHHTHKKVKRLTAISPELQRKAEEDGRREAEEIGRRVSLPHAATGGTVMRSGLVEVGERGPERVQLPKGAQITPLKPGSMVDTRPIIIQVNGRELFRANRRELLEAQAAGG